MSNELENKALENTKKALEELSEYNSVFEELDSPFEASVSINTDNNTFIQNQILISEIKEKQEITNRLNSLNYNVGWLKSAIIMNDKNIIDKTINNILKHENSSITVIVSELNSLRNKIDEFENFHTDLLKNSLSLDEKTIMEQDFREKHKKLNDLHNKQKIILLNLSDIFVACENKTCYVTYAV
ncbi:MAG: hypothetical protein IIA45_06605 [Bacteroidetes bacterium]|nr:hypothetical protein [Bacteroidota bacterium]